MHYLVSAGPQQTAVDRSIPSSIDDWRHHHFPVDSKFDHGSPTRETDGNNPQVRRYASNRHGLHQSLLSKEFSQPSPTSMSDSKDMKDAPGPNPSTINLSPPRAPCSTAVCNAVRNRTWHHSCERPDINRAESAQASRKPPTASFLNQTRFQSACIGRPWWYRSYIFDQVAGGSSSTGDRWDSKFIGSMPHKKGLQSCETMGRGLSTQRGDHR